MIVVEPRHFTTVDFDAVQIAHLAQRSLESVAALPDDLDVRVEVAEHAATSVVRIESMTPVVLGVDSGAIEHHRQPRSLGGLESRIIFTRLFLEVTDREAASFAGPELGHVLTHAHRMAWDVNLYGRTARHGLRLHQPRYRYNFRARHGFHDLADRTFDALWSADELTWAQIVELSDRAVDPVNGPPPG